MLETSLQSTSASPSDTALDLLSFFRHEYPLGGSVEGRFLRFFPLLCDRIFGPVILLSLYDTKNGGISHSSNASTQQQQSALFKPEDIAAMQASWLLKKSPWRSSSSSSLSSKSPNPKRYSSQSSIGNQEPRMNAPFSKSTTVQSSSSSSSLFDSDPVIQLLSPFTASCHSNKYKHITMAYNSCLLHILESTDLSSQLQNACLPFPFVELPKKLQQSFIRQMQQQQQHQHQQDHVQGQSPSDIVWKMMHRPPKEQRELIKVIYQYQQGIQNVASGGGGNDGSNRNRRHQHQQHSPSSPTFHLSKNPFSSTPTSQQQYFAFDQIGSSGGGGSTILSNQSNRQGKVPPLSTLRNATVLLDPWEYYMILFLRHGVTPIKVKGILQQHGKPDNSTRRNITTYAEKVYYQLFRSYCEYYITHNFDNLQIDNNRKMDSNDNQDQPLSSSSSGLGGDDVELEVIRGKRSEMWIRLIVEFFFELNNDFPGTQEALDKLSPDARMKLEESGLASSYALATLLPISSSQNSLNPLGQGLGVSLTNQSFTAPSKHVIRSMRYLIDRIIRDPTIAYNCNSRNKTAQSLRSQWPLPKAQTLLQPSFYNYIRTAIRHGPIHMKHSSFYNALDVWLIWLEPWNVVKRKKGKAASIQNAKHLLTNVSDRVIGSPPKHTSNRKTQEYQTTLEKPKSTSASKYTPAWETYVAANLHLYLVPLSIFLFRAREFDFSKDGFNSAVDTVRKVFRVFSPALVKTLQTLMIHNVSDDLSNNDKALFSLVQSHEHILGKFRPPRPQAGDNEKNTWKMELLQQDMHALLEEIILQQRKSQSERDFFERLDTRLQRLVGGTQSEEQTIKTIVEKGKGIANFPKNYKVFPDGNGDTSNALNTSQSLFEGVSPEHDQRGYMTETGRIQLREGSKICNAMDISFIGDPLYARIKDYESQFVLTFAIFLSNWLNDYFGFSTSPQSHRRSQKRTDISHLLKEQNDVRGMKFRINLRFIADTRNWLFFVVIVLSARVIH